MVEAAVRLLPAEAAGLDVGEELRRHLRPEERRRQQPVLPRNRGVQRGQPQCDTGIDHVLRQAASVRRRAGSTHQGSGVHTGVDPFPIHLKGESTMSAGTVRFHRILRAPPERVYRAFLEPDALAKWLPPYGFTCTVHRLEAVVGGRFKMSFRNFSTGSSHSFGGEYLELVPGRLVRYTDSFDDPNLPGVMRVTVKMEAVSCGTELSVVQEGIPEVIPLEMCCLGWQESLAQLATLVEPDIPG